MWGGGVVASAGRRESAGGAPQTRDGGESGFGRGFAWTFLEWKIALFRDLRTSSE
jgi:hypothetical protein